MGNTIAKITPSPMAENDDNRASVASAGTTVCTVDEESTVPDWIESTKILGSVEKQQIRDENKFWQSELSADLRKFCARESVRLGFDLVRAAHKALTTVFRLTLAHSLERLPKDLDLTSASGPVCYHSSPRSTRLLPTSTGMG